MYKTLADLLREDDAQYMDEYEAFCQVFTVFGDGALSGKTTTFDKEAMRYVSAEGWKRVTPRKPLRVEFAATVYVDTWNGGYYLVVPGVQGEPLSGKRVKVTVEEIQE